MRNVLLFTVRQCVFERHSRNGYLFSYYFSDWSSCVLFELNLHKIKLETKLNENWTKKSRKYWRVLEHLFATKKLMGKTYGNIRGVDRHTAKSLIETYIFGLQCYFFGSVAVEGGLKGLWWPKIIQQKISRSWLCILEKELNSKPQRTL